MRRLIQEISRRNREQIRRWIPPVLRDFFNDLSECSIRYVGRFSNWETACKAANGYASPSLFERIERTALLVKEGKGAWERDGVIYERILPNYPLLAAIEHAALACGQRIRVLDFGGALGSSYFQLRSFVPANVGLYWTILEQPHIVESGRRHFQTEALRFVSTLEEGIESGVPDLVLFSSVLQYLENPYDTIESVQDLGVQYLVIDRNPCSRSGEILTVQVVPESLYAASYPSWIFDFRRMQERLCRSYEQVMSWDSLDPPIRGKGMEANFNGGLWRYRGKQ